jgi:hypothetical protein
LDKPLTRILPELHEDNEDIVSSVYGTNNKSSVSSAAPSSAIPLIGTKTSTGTNGVYKVKRQSEKMQGPSKSSIIKDKFGIF